MDESTYINIHTDISNDIVLLIHLKRVGLGLTGAVSLQKMTPMFPNACREEWQLDAAGGKKNMQ